jgi:4-hydroxythreonine-4-phosphate dehydrogenase
MIKSKIRVAITMGDPSGIGPEVTLKTLPFAAEIAPVTVIGDSTVLARLGRFKKTKNVSFVDLKNVARGNFSFGKLKAEYGRASLEYLKEALRLMGAGEIDCLVTAPVSKEAIYKAGLKFSGQTEYLAWRTRASGAVMMLSNRYFKFSLVTRHLPLNDVARALNKKELTKVICSTHKALKKLFAFRHPRIAVCGLNPHASDNGVIGKEENSIIKPVVQKLKSSIGHLEGPLSSDVAIARAYKKEYDAVIAMYHDQALIPLKLSDVSSGVNMTLGLPFVRTSPLHGTAFDIAGKNLADAHSMIEAVRLAVQCSKNLET